MKYIIKSIIFVAVVWLFLKVYLGLVQTPPVTQTTTTPTAITKTETPVKNYQSVKINEDEKELDSKYIGEISPYLNNISEDWYTVSGLTLSLNSQTGKKTLYDTFQDIQDNWNKILDSNSRNTKNIKKLRDKLSEVCYLQRSAINDISSTVFLGKDDGVKKGNKKLDDAIKKMEDANRLINKMKL